jgi:hypothetical protein
MLAYSHTHFTAEPRITKYFLDFAKFKLASVQIDYPLNEAGILFRSTLTQIRPAQYRSMRPLETPDLRKAQSVTFPLHPELSDNSSNSTAAGHFPTLGV